MRRRPEGNLLLLTGCVCNLEEVISLLRPSLEARGSLGLSQGAAQEPRACYIPDPLSTMASLDKHLMGLP
ncbi:hypothetical protein Y1Q_0000209 [Alligator mississippiensis]|uniref:Uncharacterized protein n=1 Tax=Alligator mississippiensis TaxID=8496 RepID=A0A151MP11_ALLMI|nr:hypothetical protein Y1Q_0000209 [Alligator mississippiensis]